ncbi:hypothetical protein Solca_2822 [Solitalea canadensis DSM 3403]|uniref:Uncharacterized protein n=1 Tax=Solitalea canadensis (strain ATCC 29591 / DSM 3403 / JCM 21819 / LMG 8368 / NBRC 15130 / NCIMB 12057 / USAM 9D) TaxID=929556 RepID=H8KS60_SOLCM|nr:hypothetical protein Solca_2822 [Solitalea canadensis DSM 3403]
MSKTVLIRISIFAPGNPKYFKNDPVIRESKQANAGKSKACFMFLVLTGLRFQLRNKNNQKQ